MTDKGWVDDFNLHYESVDRLFERGQTFHNFNDHDYMVLEALSPALLAKGLREAGQTINNAFHTFADKPEVDYSQKEQKHPFKKGGLPPFKEEKKTLSQKGGGGGPPFLISWIIWL